MYDSFCLMPHAFQLSLIGAKKQNWNCIFPFTCFNFYVLYSLPVSNFTKHLVLYVLSKKYYPRKLNVTGSSLNRGTFFHPHPQENVVVIRNYYVRNFIKPESKHFLLFWDLTKYEKRISLYYVLTVEFGGMRSKQISSILVTSAKSISGSQQVLCHIFANQL